MAPKKKSKQKGKEEPEFITTYRLEVHDGLQGFDGDFDELLSLFGELQRSSADIANPELDLLTFAASAHYFGVLTRDEFHTPRDPEADVESLQAQLDIIIRNRSKLPTSFDADAIRARHASRDAETELFARISAAYLEKMQLGKKGKKKKKKANKPQGTSNDGENLESSRKNAAAGTSTTIAESGQGSPPAAENEKAAFGTSCVVPYTPPVHTTRNPDLASLQPQFEPTIRNKPKVQTPFDVRTATNPDTELIALDAVQCQREMEAERRRRERRWAEKLQETPDQGETSANLSSNAATSTRMAESDQGTTKAVENEKKATPPNFIVMYPPSNEVDPETLHSTLKEINKRGVANFSARTAQVLSISPRPVEGNPSTDFLIYDPGIPPLTQRPFLPQMNVADVRSHPQVLAYEQFKLQRSALPQAVENKIEIAKTCPSIPSPSPSTESHLWAPDSKVNYGWRARVSARAASVKTVSADASSNPPAQFQHNATERRVNRKVAGLIYLINSQTQDSDPLHSCELNLGIIVKDQYRRCGWASQAIEVLLDKAFKDQLCNRVQAIVVDGPFKHAAMNLFMKSGFGHEGTRRRAFRSPYNLEFKDSTCLGVLATDWILRSHQAILNGGTVDGVHSISRFSIAPTSLWEEMFERHQREREELLRWEETDDTLGRLKRTLSSETIKEAYHSTTDADNDPTSAAEATDSESVCASGRSRAGSIPGSSSKAPASNQGLRSQSPDASSESDFSEISELADDSAS
ncbi:hypothetical protein BKA70DRAFT_1276674, partial [Coprinopsis sp. MPI-PUGE-AT-0042]